ncbi:MULTISPECIES: class I adenylate-forming enzyme family protein [Frankia]|uniref:Long-chain-fatty-acid-CoA ligase n=1 Tax=Frankia alni (strain DSM 45986 / CECT 9034 / ACN14a) TaxID=326424 RepID=Q0RF46_FRAAA|nr:MULTISPECIES: class I adenylate-forming enzyme family protein [Frankia]CAJ63905.1 putative long-chain-fatty-acid-CoA ligase [Frankia alni ACN14a]
MVLTADSTWELVEARAAASPDGLAVIDEHRRHLTFRELRDRAEAAAVRLRALGVGPGSVVSWQLPNTIDTVVVCLALARLGAVQNPLIMMLREREITFVCRQAGSELLLVPSAFRGVDHAALARTAAAAVPGLAVHVVDTASPVDTAPRDISPGEAVPGVAVPGEVSPGRGSGGAAVSSTEPVVPVRWIFYTSGTTSDPKGARHTDQGLLAASATFCDHLAVVPTDRLPILLPISHIGGITHLLTGLQTGCGVIVSRGFDPASTPDALAAAGVTLVGAGTQMLQAYLARQRRQPAVPLFPLARAALCGGAGRPEALHFEVKELLGGVGVISGYGLTECPFVTWGRHDDTDSQHASTEGCAGLDVEIVVMLDDATPAAAGEVGEIRVRGPQLMVGYVDAAADRDAFDAKGFLRTGDLGTLDEDGYLRITGRIKDVIIRKGENVSARELEELLLGHPAVGEVAVVGLPDASSGERVCAVVVPADPADPPDLATLCAHLRAQGLNNRKLPEQLELVPELPRNAMGKVVKRDLTARFAH